MFFEDGLEEESSVLFEHGCAMSLFLIEFYSE
jgi:hypothetical protein